MHLPKVKTGFLRGTVLKTWHKCSSNLGRHFNRSSEKIKSLSRGKVKWRLLWMVNTKTWLFLGYYTTINFVCWYYFGDDRDIAAGSESLNGLTERFYFIIINAIDIRYLRETFAIFPLIFSMSLSTLTSCKKLPSNRFHIHFHSISKATYNLRSTH